MNPDLKLYTQNKITEIIGNLDNLTACGNASDVIDFYQKGNPEDRAWISEMRNWLCDRTFEIFKLTHNTKPSTSK